MKPEKEKPQKHNRHKTKTANPEECASALSSSPSDGLAQQSPNLTTTEKTRKKRDAGTRARREGRCKPKTSKSQTKQSKLVVSEREVTVDKILKTEATDSLGDECDQVLPEVKEKEENNLTPEKHQDSVKTKKRRKAQTRGNDKKPKPVRKDTAKGDSEIGSKETTFVKEESERKEKKAEKRKSGRKKQKTELEFGLVSRKTRKRKVQADALAAECEKKQKLGAQENLEKTTVKARAKKSVARKGTTKRGGAKGKKETKDDFVLENVNGEDDAEDPMMANAVFSKAAKFVGAHMSIAGGLENAVKDAVATGSKAFALFLRSQRQWVAKPLGDVPAEKFRQACQEMDFPPHLILPHGSYLLNCGSPNDETLRKSREALIDELKRCEKLGLTRYNFHPGSTCGDITVDECLDKIAETINLVHQETNDVMTVIENMSCQGNTVGGRFEELSGIIKRVNDKSRIGVCLDTCHAFAAGFDLSSESGYQDMMTDFDRIIGLKYLVAVHLNDSKGKVGSHLDRHENIGKGRIGLEAFRRLMNDPRFDNIPLILETPVGDGMDYSKEIKLLNSMVGKATKN